MSRDPADEAAATWLVDVNVLVALTLTSHVHHRAAHDALRGHPGRWATCPATEAALLRLLLNPRVSGRDVDPAEARAVLGGLRDDPRWRRLVDDSDLVAPVVDLSVLRGHRQVADLHLVDLAARHGCTLVTFDAGLAATLTPADRGHVRVLRQ